MSDALSFVEIDDQHAELLPGRTVLSLFATGNTSASNNCGNGGGNGNDLVGILSRVLSGANVLSQSNCTATAG